MLAVTLVGALLSVLAMRQPPSREMLVTKREMREASIYYPKSGDGSWRLRDLA